jgi:glycosyltransferase involved in cell wall biosynthesis
LSSVTTSRPEPVTVDTTVLLLCHATAAEAALDAAAQLWSGATARGAVDLLTWGGGWQVRGGRTSAGRHFDLSSSASGRARRSAEAVRLLVDLRRRRYDVVAVAQPRLDRSRARGLLLALAHILADRSAVTLSGQPRRQPRTVSRRAAAIDLARWALLQVGSLALAIVAERALRASGGPPTPSRAPRPLRAGGAAVYLRTDINLSLEPLAAGGSLSHTIGVVRGLEQSGYDVRVWTTMPVVGIGPNTLERWLPNFRCGNVPTEILELVSGLLQGLDPRARRPERASLVYQRYTLNNLAGLILARRWRVPFVLEANSSEVEWRRRWEYLRYAPLAEACERVLLSRADAVVTVSENARAELERVGAPPERVCVVPNAVEVDRFAHATARPLPFPDGAVVVGFVGLFYRWHGVQHLARAFVDLHARVPNARLMLLGDGEDAPAVRAVLEEAGVMDACHLPGLVPRDAVPGYLAAADILVSPHAEMKDFVGSPIKIFEYMAAGRAIVASRLGQLESLLSDGETALLVPPGDEGALAAALERVAVDKRLRGELGSRAQQEALRRHSWEARVRELLDWYGLTATPPGA